MKPITAKLSDEFKEIELMICADYHYGDPHCDVYEIERDIEYIKSRENVYCIFAGDLMNCAIRSSIGDVYTDLSPMEQLTVCTELLGPIAHKCLAVVTGNHENRHYKTNGVDMTRILARQLGIEDKYSEDTALLFLRFGKDSSKNHSRPILYTVYVTHGSGGGRKEGGKIQRLVDYSNVVDADLYIAGHTHLPASLKIGYARPSPANNSITYCQKLFVNSSAKLLYGGYGDVGGFRPPALDSPRVILSGDRKDMRAVV